MLVAGLCVWGVILYAHTLNAPFYFDDDATILKNPVIRDLSDPALWKHPDYRKRIVTFYSFALNYKFHGFDVRGYHAVNIAIHLLTALLVGWLIALLLGTPRMKGTSIAERADPFAFLGAWLFMSHPIQTQAVTYVCQRFECLAALFYVLSIGAYLKGRMSVGDPFRAALFFVIAALAACLGIFSKEIVFTLPGAIFLIEWVFFSGSFNRPKDPVILSRGVAKDLFFERFFPCSCFRKKAHGQNDANSVSRRPVGPIWTNGWGWLVAVIFGAALVSTLRSLDLPGIFATHAKMGISATTYLLTQFRVILKYFGLLFFPYSQNLDHDLSWSTGPFDGMTLPSLLVVILLIVAAFRSARRFPLISFGILWFFLTLSVSSSIVPQKDAVMEHRLYLPSVGFFIALLAGLYRLIRNFRGFLVGVFGLVLSLSFLTWQRNALWADEVKFWEDVALKSPNKFRSHTNLGLVYRKHGEYTKAIAAYETALRLRPPLGEPLGRIYTNLGAVYGVMGRYREEISLYLKAIAADPKNYQAYSNLGYAYALVGDYRNALVYGEAAVKMAPRFDEAWNNLGVTHARMEHYQEAAYAFQGALRINPYYKEAASNLRLAREKLGHA